MGSELPVSDSQQAKRPAPLEGPTVPVLHLQGSRPDVPLPASVAAGIDAAIAMAVQPAPVVAADPPPKPVEPAAMSRPVAPDPVAPLSSEPVAQPVAPPPPPEVILPTPEVEAEPPPPPPAAKPAKREKPTYEWPKARPPADPVPEVPPAAPPARSPLGEVMVIYLSALLAMLAVGLLIYLEMQGRERDELIVRELVALREKVDALEAQPVVAPQPEEVELEAVAQPQPLDFPTNDGTIDAILALQKRVNALEEAAKGPLPTPSPMTTSRTQLLDEPTSDCIPIETRFVALPGESYPICRTPEVIKLTNITADTVTTDNGASIAEGGFTRLAFGNCTLLVISADVEGFAEMRVTCS